MRASFKCLRVESSTCATTQPPSSGVPTAVAYVNSIAIVGPLTSTSGDSSIQSMLDTIMTIQVAHGQLLVDVLLELQGLHADLASIRWSLPPPPFDDDF